MTPYRGDYPTLDGLALTGQRVLLRADLNVPMQNAQVSDATRIRRIMPTLRHLTAQGARVAVLSHFGRPQGRIEDRFSLAPVVPVLAEYLGVAGLAFATDCIGPPARDCMAALQPGRIAVFENLRFHAGEEANDPDFARALATQGDLYVNDAFSCAHRPHASISAMGALLPAVMGYAMADELAALETALESPQRPAAAIVGGAKISGKLAVLRHIIDKVDHLVVGGGMANTFLHARGIPVGKSLCEPDLGPVARDILAHAQRADCEMILPEDVVVAPSLTHGDNARALAVDAVDRNSMIFDIGPRSITRIKTRLESCKTVLWNGPLGAFETPPFDAATCDISRHAAALTGCGCLTSIAGGGDTAAALAHAGVENDFTYLSSAGGAFLAWLEGKELPGLAALRK